MRYSSKEKLWIATVSRQNATAMSLPAQTRCDLILHRVSQRGFIKTVALTPDALMHFRDISGIQTTSRMMSVKRKCILLLHATARVQPQSMSGSTAILFLDSIS